MKFHYYPGHLATEMSARWPVTARPLPPLVELEYFISVAYQASLVFEEAQPVRCRLVLSALEELLPAPGANGPYVLELAAPRPYEEQEIRRLAPALRSPGSLLAVRADVAAGLLIWGLLRNHSPWGHPAEARPFAPGPLPPALQLEICGPGNLVFYHGPDRMLTLQNGHVEGHGFVEYPLA